MEALVAAAAPAISSLLLGRISSCSSAHLKQKYVQSSCILSARLQGSNLVAKTQRSSLATIPVSLGKFQKIEVPRKRIRGRPFVLKASTATADMSTSEREISVGGKGGVALKEYADMKALAAGFAEFVKAKADEAVAERGHFTIVLSGGSLVKALGNLAEAPYRDAVDWARWQVLWADERKVDLADPDSNYKAASEEFLAKVPIPAGQVHAINPALSVSGCAEDYETNLRHLVKAGVVAVSSDGFPRFDLICLGMGPDGHIASLFPHHPLLQEATKWVAPISDSPKPPPERITLTYPVINAAANVAFVATGASKVEVLRTAFGPPVPPGSLPAQDVYPLNGKLCWFVDSPAVSGLF